MKIYFAFLTFVFAVPVVADDHAAIVNEAFSNVSNAYHEEWAFTQSTSEEGVQIVLRYDPRFPKSERWKLITVDGHYVQYIDLRNEGAIRPVFGVKIKRFLTHLTFGPAGSDGPIVPLSIDVELKGRAMLFVKIDESESVRYTDYEYVGT
jgi:hypothetical protein